MHSEDIDLITLKSPTGLLKNENQISGGYLTLKKKSASILITSLLETLFLHA